MAPASARFTRARWIWKLPAMSFSIPTAKLFGTTCRRPKARSSGLPEWCSPQGKLFAGDGGGPNSVAAPGNGQWIYLFTPHDGAFEAEKLVDLSKHNYRLEPNVTFTPDGKWLVFRSNMLGPTYVFAVELGKGS